MTVITRFAPSPTGFLHIGGARTALFNWLFAKHHGGQFLLRIEDTDRARSSQEAVDAILDGLSWLGLTWDGEPTYQFARADRHVEVANELLAKGQAYKCYTTAEELAAFREANEHQKFQSPWRDKAESDAPAGAPFAIRLRAPMDADVVIEDGVQGTVTFPAEQMDDLILVRSDGTPTYMLAVVVDDHDMGITHVIRGDDHLTNAARQTLIYNAMGWQVPAWSHIPLIHGADGAKLSKRHGALGAEAYREMGFLPEALRNYLLRLGWGHGDTEIVSTEEAIKLFDISGIGKAPSRFDMAKLEHMNGHYIREADDARLYELCAPNFPEGATEQQKTWFKAFLPELKTRARTLPELNTEGEFLFAARPLNFTEKAEKALNDEAKAHVKALAADLQNVSEWTDESLHAALNAYGEKAGVKAGKYLPAMRAALTGKHASAGNVAGILVLLGREESLARLLEIE